MGQVDATGAAAQLASRSADRTAAPLAFHGSRFRRLEDPAATPRPTGPEESS
ncbi:hypothetical protein SBRY_40901 [Actinacidiphila bryophytorum]|uniref:Uncharacterized protein n=1 Tax=Actinacidiphila bryophytorum TaxID=1436133 RepID=A0A9W4H3V8_9ACTN|nr:hypothetical protein SBRY_40901 [Actinacidiphila bryophytorum]